MGKLSFPGETIRRGSSNQAAVRAVQQALNARGCGPIEVDGRFGAQTEGAVRLFQTRYPDAAGQPMLPDGEIGPIAWGALFGVEAAPKLAKASGMGRRVLDIASGQLGVMEEPPGSNAGPRVSEYLACVGIGPGHSWCAAFVYWCAEQAANGNACILPRSPGVQRMWRDGLAIGLPSLRTAEAMAQPSRITPGMIFFIAHDRGLGHTGFVEGLLPNGRLQTIEGNTNDGASREGVGVFRLTRRTIGSINLGFLALG